MSRLSHREVRATLQQIMDGYLEDSEFERLEPHLIGCPRCRAYLEQTFGIHRLLQEEAPALWPQPEPSAQAIAQTVLRVKKQAQLPVGNHLYGANLWDRIWASSRELAWVALILVFILAAGWYALRRTPAVGTPLFAKPVPVPPAVITPPQDAIHEIQAANPSGNFDSTNPVITADGRWIAFSSRMDTLIPGDTNQAADILVYDRLTQTIERVSVASDGSQANGDSYFPGISDNGRWVVFSSQATNLTDLGTSNCLRNFDGIPCTNVYLHDRTTGETMLVSIGANRIDPTGESIFPVISGNGRWIAFWSTASYPVNGEVTNCQGPNGTSICEDIYLYDRATGDLKRLAINIPDFTFSGTNLNLPLSLQLDLSADGRYLTFSVQPPGISTPVEENKNVNPGEGVQVGAWVYDRETDQFIQLDMTPEGIPGNGISYMPQISRDGRFAAFVSEADNLVPGDTNGKSDVFIRDLETGDIERVSVNSRGEEGDDDSGNLNGIGNLAISQGGQQILFYSRATNLGEDNSKCEDSSNLFFSCVQLFLRDRLAGSTLQILIPPDVFGGPAQGENQLILFPSLSENSRWLAINAIRLDCNTGVCSDVFLLDLDGGLARQLNEYQSEESLSGRWIPLDNLSGHAGWVNGVAYSPDGSLLASGGNDGKVNLWQEPGGQLLRTLQEGRESISAVAFSPDGSFLAVGIEAGSVRMYRTSDWVLAFNLEDHPGLVQSLAFSPDGKTLAVGALRSVWLWENVDGVFFNTHRFSYGKGYVTSLAFSSDGRLLAATTENKTVWVRSLPDGNVVLNLGGQSDRVLSVAFSPVDGTLAMGSADHTILLWKIDWDGKTAQATYLRTLGTQDWVKSLAFSPDGRLLAAGSFDGSTTFWEAQNGKPLYSFRQSRQEQVLSLAFSPDADLLAAGTVQGSVRQWGTGPRAVSNQNQPEGNGTPHPESRFFKRAVADQIWETSLYVSPLAPTSYSQPESISLEEAQKQAGFDLALPPDPLPGFTLQFVFVYDLPGEPEKKVVEMGYIQTSSYQPAYLMIHQSLSNPRESLGLVGQTASIEEITVRGQAAEYVQGGWEYNWFSNNPTALYLGRTQKNWNGNSGTKQLRWQEGEVYISIELYQPFNEQAVTEQELFTKEDLIALAESLH